MPNKKATGADPPKMEQCYATFVGARPDPNDALISSVSSTHFSPQRELFKDYRPDEPQTPIETLGKVIYAVGRGDLEIDVPMGKGAQVRRVVLKDALHVPDCAMTMISVGRLMKDYKGMSMEFGRDETVLRHDGQVWADIPPKDGVPKFPARQWAL